MQVASDSLLSDSVCNVQRATPTKSVKIMSIKVRIYLLLCLSLIGSSARTQQLEQESRYITQYEQYAARTEFTASKFATFISSQYKNNAEVKLALSGEIADLQTELGEFLGEAKRSSISLQKLGFKESRSYAYMLEAGNAMFSQLNVMYIITNRNEPPLLKALSSYREIKILMEREFRLGK
ncbi:MAG: hypothetical protein KGL18_14145 [Burkholderiales bacterium]|nr:hypothetical protein [Burkholderiales bacterium]